MSDQPNAPPAKLRTFVPCSLDMSQHKTLLPRKILLPTPPATISQKIPRAQRGETHASSSFFTTARNVSFPLLSLSTFSSPAPRRKLIAAVRDEWSGESASTSLPVSV